MCPPPIPMHPSCWFTIINSWPILFPVCSQTQVFCAQCLDPPEFPFPQLSIPKRWPWGVSLCLSPACGPGLENTSSVTFYYIWWATQGVLVAGRTKGQLCWAAHKLGHLWRLSSNSQLVFRRALIMPSASLLKESQPRWLKGAMSDWLDLHNHLP